MLLPGVAAEELPGQLVSVTKHYEQIEVCFNNSLQKPMCSSLTVCFVDVLQDEVFQLSR